MMTLLLAVVIPDPASRPTARVAGAGRYCWSAKIPMAVLLLPSVLLSRGRTPKATLLKPGGIGDERVKTGGRVGAGSVVLKRTITDRRVAGSPSTVAKQGERSNGRVLVADGVAQKRSGANGRIFACGIDKERPGADTGVEVGIGVA